MTPSLWRHPCATVTICCALALIRVVPAGDSVRRYGGATPGSGNISPTVWVNSTPRPGNTGFSLRVDRALGGTWCFPFMSTQPADFSFAGVRFLVDTQRASYGGAVFLPGQGNGGGSGNIPVTVANNPGLIGVPIYVQVFTLDDFAPNPLGIAATTGLCLTPAMPAQLLIARALNGAPDPQTAVDLAANAVVDYDRSQFDDSSGVVLAQGGAAALQIDPATSRLRAFDTSAFPPVWQGNTALRTDGRPDQIVLTPDGSRAYVLYTGAPNSSPPIVAHDAQAGANFGRPWPGTEIRLERVADPRGIAFTPDSNTAFVVALGPLSGGDGSLTRVNVRPGSAFFHQMTGQLTFSGQLATDVAIAADGATLYVSLVNPSGFGEIAVIDVATFSVRDMDAGAPGVQNLGGESSQPRTPLPVILGRTLADPRGQELYCASVGGVARVHIDPDSPLFRRVTMVTAGIAPTQLVTQLALTDAADRLYAATAQQLVEFDTRQLTAARMWPISGTTSLALR